MIMKYPDKVLYRGVFREGGQRGLLPPPTPFKEKREGCKKRFMSIFDLGLKEVHNIVAQPDKAGIIALIDMDKGNFIDLNNKKFIRFYTFSFNIIVGVWFECPLFIILIMCYVRIYIYVYKRAMYI